LYRRRDREGKRRWRWILLVISALVAAWGVFGAVYVGPEPSIEVELERPAIGAPTAIIARFAEPRRGLGDVALSLHQGERSLILGQSEALHPSPWKPWERGVTEVTLAGRAGRREPEWLEEGEVVIRAVAERMSGILRRAAPVVVEKRVTVRLRPPSLSVLSGPLYVRQGGSGAIVFRPGETTVLSGVVAGEAEFRSYPLPGATGGERFVLFGVPWSLGEVEGIALFAEDDAGNRSVKRAPDGFRPAPPRRDTIRLSDGFIERVVPAIASQTPKLDTSLTPVEQYLWINGELRRQNRAFLAELSKGSAEEFLWRGAFLQLPNSARKASFAEVRSYIYNGREVDTQTHLGLDLASVARAPVPASNAGVVLHAGDLGIFGNTVVLDHGFGFVSVHAHLSAVSVSAGQQVAKAEPIGRTGATGLAGGDHLHLGLFIQGTAVDPIEWLDPQWIERNISDRLPLP